MIKTIKQKFEEIKENRIDYAIQEEKSNIATELGIKYFFELEEIMEDEKHEIPLELYNKIEALYNKEIKKEK